MRNLQRAWALILVLCTASTAALPAAPTTSLDIASATRFANLALKCLHHEYPNHISLTLETDADALPPHVLTPAFFGCYDWHSDVHGHWLLVRLLRLFPDAPFAQQARSELQRSFTAQNVLGELAFLRKPGRTSFERPYGLAWLLALAAELRQWDDPDAKAWYANLQPLENESANRIKAWLPKLHYPIRIGEHDQTAFSFGLIWDWSGVANDSPMQSLLSQAAHRFYGSDTNCPIAYEPSGEDFLSPCLAEADFMRRVLGRPEFAAWLGKFMPGIPRDGRADWLSPGVVTDRSDGKLAHIDGLNLSRSWMLKGVAGALPARDKRIGALKRAALKHQEAALPNVTGEFYEGGHWLGTFAVYLTSEAGPR